MDTRDPKQSIIFDEDAILYTTNQIRDAYESGFVDLGEGSFDLNHEEEKK